jgi:hypothetical protein
MEQKLDNVGCLLLAAVVALGICVHGWVSKLTGRVARIEDHLKITTTKKEP